LTLKKNWIVSLIILINSTASAQVIGDYQSKASGDWADDSMWQIYNGTSWVDSSIVPTGSSGTITIRSADTITIGVALTISNGTSVIVNGFLKITGGGITAPTSVPAFSFNSGGTYEHAMNAGSIPVANWNTGSTCLITGTTSTNPSPPASGTTYYNYTWNCPGQTGNLNVGWDNVTVNGDLTCSASGTPGGTVYWRLTNAATLRTITINGNVIVNGGNMTVSGSSGGAQYNVTVKGNIIVSNDGKLNLCAGSGGYGTWFVEGDVTFSDSSAFTAPSNKTINTILIFSKPNGTQSFTYMSKVANANLNYGIKNNSTVLLNSPLTVGSSSNPGFLILTSGKLITTTTNIITLAAMGSVVTGAGYVSGPLAAIINSASAKTIIFPLGKSVYRPIVLNITQSASTSTIYIAEVFDAAPPVYILPGTLYMVSSVRYYHIEKRAGANIVSATIQLSYDSTEGIDVFNKDNIRVAKDDGFGKWISLGGSGSADTVGTITSGNAIGQTSGYGTLTSNDFIVAHANPSYIPSAPVLSTNPVSFISTTTALCGGVISSDGDAAITVKGVCWSVNTYPTIADSLTNDGPTSTPFTSLMKNLVPGTTYYVRAYATNSAGTSYGNQDTLTTLIVLSAPTVVTNAVTDIVNTTAIGNGTVTAWGGTLITDRGICWGLSHNPTLLNEFNSAGAGTGGEGAFIAPIGGLTLGATYYVRAYAINNVDTAYGGEVTLTTPTPQVDISKVVDLNGIVGVNCDYKTITAAFNDVLADYTGHWYIYVRKGTYYEKPLLARNKINVVLVGENKDSTIITYDDYAGNNRTTNGVTSVGTSTSYTCAIDAADFQAQNITFQNTANAYAPGVTAAQAVALRTNGDRQSYYNCRMLGYQDTYYTWGGSGPDRIYNKNCYIEGSVDFIFGRDVALFDSCTVYCNRQGGTLTAAATEVGYTYGYVFLNCTLDSPPADSIGADGRPMTTFYLGRPWQGSPKTVFINCYEPSTVNAAGWTTMGPNPSLYAEWGCAGPGAVTSRPVITAWSGANQPSKISDSAAATYTIANIFSKKNRGTAFSFAANWTPQKLNVVFPSPASVVSTSTIDFGTVTIPAHKVDSIIIANSGNTDLNIVQITSSDRRFTINPTTANISPSGIQKFYITFMPDSAKTYNATLVFANNSIRGFDSVLVIGQGFGTPVSVENQLSGIPETYFFRDNYPNPFNPTTTFEYGLPHNSSVMVKIYSILGQEIKTLVNQVQVAGYHQLVWNASNASSGLYFVRLSAKQIEGAEKPFTQVKKILLVK